MRADPVRRDVGRGASRLAWMLAVGVGLAAAVVVVAGPAAGPAAAVGPPLLIGDSVMAGMGTAAQAELAASHPHLLDAAVCRRLIGTSCSYQGRRPANALEVVRSRAGSFGTAIVVAAGYNDDSVGAAIDAIVDEVRRLGIRNVVWLTYREAGRNTARYRAHNTTLAAKAAEHPELRVADWAGLSAGRSDWVASDGLHLNGTGAMVMARLVADALDDLTPNRCDQAAGGTLPSGGSSGVRESETTKVRLLRSPVRVIDTRATADGAVRAGHVLRVPLSGAGVPTGAPGVLATVTVTDPCEPGFVTAFGCGSAVPATSTLNYSRSGAIANAAMAPTGNAALCVYTSATTDLVVDVVAYLDDAGARVATVEPQRLVDTRPGQPSTVPVPDGPLGAGSVLAIPVARPGVEAVLLNVAAVDSRDAGFLTVYPGPCSRQPPNASSLNFVLGENIAAATTVRIGDDGKVCVYTSAHTHVLVDLSGVYGNYGSRVRLVQGVRMVDTRVVGPSPGAAELATQLTMSGAPAGSTGAIINVTAAGGVPGFVTVRRCGPGWPEHSTLNHSGQPIANLAVAPAPYDRFCAYRETPTHLAIDAVAWLVP